MSLFVIQIEMQTWNQRPIGRSCDLYCWKLFTCSSSYDRFNKAFETN